MDPLFYLEVWINGHLAYNNVLFNATRCSFEMGTLSQGGLIIIPGPEADRDNLGISFLFSIKNLVF